MASKRLIRRATLERASRPLLARFLRAHAAAFFEAHAISLDALASSSPRDRAIVHRIFDLLHDRAASPALPPALPALLATLDALATPHGGEAILRADTKGLLPRATYGDEDLALAMLLDCPDLAVEAKREAEGDEVQSFTEYEPDAPRAVRFEDEERAALVSALGERLAARDRTRKCEVHARHEGRVVALEIVHGRRPKTFDKIDAKALTIEPSTDIHAERAFVEIDLDSGACALHAARGTKEDVRAALGEVLGGSASWLRPARTYDLAPFARLSEVTSIEGASPRLRRVEIHALHVMTANGGTTMSFARARKDLLGDDEAREAIDAALGVGRVVAVKVYLSIEGRARPLGVELSTKGSGNLVDFDRSDAEIVEIVRGWMRARGIVRDASRMSATLDAPLTPPAPSPMKGEGERANGVSLVEAAP